MVTIFNGGTIQGIAGINLNFGDKLSEFSKIIPTASRTGGYTFKHWALQGQTNVAYNFDTPVTKDIRLLAIWEKTIYTVKFDTDGGSGSFPDVKVEHGSKVKEPSSKPTKSGYNFKYWALKGQTTEYDFSNTPVTSNITLVAIWEEKSCLAEGSLITLADGSQKAVEDLVGDEMLLVWNMFTGQYEAAPILAIDKDPYAKYEVINLKFSDGSSVKVISEHAFWDYDLNRYVYLDEGASQYIGHWFNKMTKDASGNAVSDKVQLVEVNIKEEQTTAWSPVTYGHLCYYVNGMLSMPGGIDGLFNIFEVDSTTMKYDEAAMEEDIAQYGLFTYEELAKQVSGLTEDMFEAVNGQYLKVSIGKGLITIEEIQALIDRYATFFA